MYVTFRTLTAKGRITLVVDMAEAPKGAPIAEQLRNPEEVARLALGRLVGVGREEDTLGPGESLTGLVYELVSAMPPGERDRRADTILAGGARKAFPADRIEPGVTRGGALLLAALAADRRRAMGMKDSMPARYVGYLLFAGQAGTAGAAQIVVASGRKASSIPNAISTLTRTVRESEWSESLVDRIASLASSPETSPDGWRSLLPEVIAVERAKPVQSVVTRSGKVATEAATKDAFVAEADADELPLITDAELDRETAGLADGVRAYLRSATKRPLLKPEEEVDLAKQIEAGLFARERLDSGEAMAEELRRDLELIARNGAKAKDWFIEANLRLVVSIAKRLTGRGMAFLDLIQEGNLGLTRAVEKFDYEKGYKFSTYATWWIRQSTSRALADQARTIRVPVHMVENFRRLSGAERALAQAGQTPTPEALARELDITPEKVIEWMDYRREPISLDRTLGDDTETTMGDLIADADAPDGYDNAERVLRDELIHNAIGTLTVKEAFVVRERFGLGGKQGRTLEEIGQDLGVTRERIRQIELNAIRKLGSSTRLGAHKEFLSEAS
jgi:RNA polymerase primary sigma factor